jgi:ABC-2 type transport system permease protein
MRLSWRDFQGMMTAGRRRRFPVAMAILAAVVAVLHLPALAMVGRYAQVGVAPDPSTLFSATLIVALYLSLLLSQAMETVTRTLYSRGDLDLVLSSPVTPARLFAVRIVTNAVLMALMAVALVAPFVDALIFAGGPRWLAAYAAAGSAGLIAGAVAVAVTVGLFRLLGPRRTRIVAQVAAAVIGAAFAIGLQVSAIMVYGGVSRAVFAASPAMLLHLPAATSLLWLPARALLGDLPSLAVVVGAAVGLLALTATVFAPRLGEHSLAASAIAPSTGHRRRRAHDFRVASASAALRHKEWLLLRRDPWLVSQTLTQMLYLIPPALLLIRNFGSSSGTFVVVVMVLVSVGGQLAGALAWLAVSGEDAPDLVRAAPVSPGAVTRAKVEAVMGAVALLLAPLMIAVAVMAPLHALAAVIGTGCSAASTILIQLWFRAQAKRSLFRRRHTSSRIATFAEALVSFSWAAAAGLAAAGTWFALASVAVALLILAGVKSLAPRTVDA